MCWWMVGHNYEYVHSLYPRELQGKSPGIVFERFAAEIYECKRCGRRVARRDQFHSIGTSRGRTT